MKKMLTLSVLLCLLTGCSKPTVDNSVVTTFELSRFLGNWYEIARFDHRFERGMEQTKANYVLRKDG
ncbi:MAG: lipocalin family protein [Paraprevotella sp.]|nr:lipocalin family protein [Paraprevotella sp.]